MKKYSLKNLLREMAGGPESLITDATTVAELLAMGFLNQSHIDSYNADGTLPFKSKSEKAAPSLGNLDRVTKIVAYFLTRKYLPLMPGMTVATASGTVGPDKKTFRFGKKDAEKMLDAVLPAIGLPCPAYPSPGCAREYVDVIFDKFVAEGILQTNESELKAKAKAKGVPFSRYGAQMKRGFPMDKMSDLSALSSDIPDSDKFDLKESYNFKKLIKEFQELETELDFETFGEEELFDFGSNAEALETYASQIDADAKIAVDDFLGEDLTSESPSEDALVDDILLEFGPEVDDSGFDYEE